MKTIHEESTVDHLAVEQWLQVRKEKGRNIDPDTAEVDWSYALTLDPYGEEPPSSTEPQEELVLCGVGYRENKDIAFWGERKA